MVKIDKEKCIGCNICVAMCSDCFKMNENGKAEFTGSKDCDCDIDEVIKACPVDAISK